MNVSMSSAPLMQRAVTGATDAPQLVFLLYVNRSGSTYLASRLAELPGVVVTLESEALRGLLLSPRPICTQEECAGFLQQLFAEPKFQQWGVSPEALHRALQAAPRPLTREQLLRTLLRLLPGGDRAHCFVLKVPRLLESLPRARALLSDCKVLHVVRDPRAVFASQRRSISSRTGRPMVRDAVTAGLRWRRAMEALAVADLPQVLEVRYEDLVTSPQSSLDRVVQFLQLDSAEQSAYADAGATGGDYLARIPQDQRHLHTNVGKAADPSRINRWASELSAGDVWLLERACGRVMAGRGYRPQSALGRLPGAGDILGACLSNARFWLRDITARLLRRVSA